MTRLSAIKQRLQAATPGPWRKEQHGHDGGGSWSVHIDHNNAVFLNVGGCGGDAQVVSNAAFIAHSPEDIALLVRLAEKVEAVMNTSNPLLPPDGHPALATVEEWRLLELADALSPLLAAEGE